MLEGIILINKNVGPTSHDVTRTVKKLLHANKCGHTGSLDPLASGMLPICVNNATKIANLFLNGSKVYIAQIRLGETTTTGDSEGAFIKRLPVETQHTDLIPYIESRFIGPIIQTPPMYSAIKVGGQKLYNLARQGKSILVPSREVILYENTILHFEKDTYTLHVRIKCSKGTYIRTLAEDIGKFLGCGGYLKALYRESVCNINPHYMISIEHLNSIALQDRAKYVYSVEQFFPNIKSLVLSLNEIKDITNGRYKPPHDGLLKLYYQETFIGLIESREEHISLKYLLNLPL